MVAAILMMLFIAGCGEKECDLECNYEGYARVDDVGYFCEQNGYVSVVEVNKLINITNQLIEGTNAYFNASIEPVIYYKVYD